MNRLRLKTAGALVNPKGITVNSKCPFSDNSYISEGASRYGDFATGVAPGIKSMRNSTCRCGGNLDKSSRNTLVKSRTTGISLNSGSSALVFISVFVPPKVRSP
ncbi:hypothetical protein Tco_0246111 [Tanacetum coccineum]